MLQDSFICSDLHLGSQNSEAELFLTFIADVVRPSAKRLILNGDMINSFDFRKFNKFHWNVLSEIRKLADDIEVIWICGNHDGPADIISNLIGLPVIEEYAFRSGDTKILCLHGHTFDKFIDNHPFVTSVADVIYNFLQIIDPSHSFARMAKHSSKHYLHCSKIVHNKAIKYKKECDVVCCGHVHYAVSDKETGYYNSGCWTERPCTYLKVSSDGIVELKKYCTAMYYSNSVM